MMPSSFRRRGQLVPLDPPEENTKEFEGIGDDESSYTSESNVFEHYVSPCEFRVSNDPMLVSANDVCDTTIYGCVRDHSFLIHARDGVIEVPVSYDYDLFYNLDNPAYTLNDIVEFLEGSMLEHLATVVDLKQCPPTTISSGRNRADSGNNGLRRLVTFTEQQKTAFIAIKSGPADNEAIAYECLSPPENGTECHAMEGALTLYLEEARVSPDEQEFLENLESIKNTVLNVLQDGMNLNVYTKGAVQKLVFIGNRTVGPGVSESDSTMIEEIQGVLVPAEEDSAVLGGATIGAIAGASGFVLIVTVLALLLVRRRTARADEVSKARLDEDDGYGLGREVTIIVANRRRASQKRVAPALTRQYSLEGAEIPGSLAAMDALALKPQNEGIEVGDDDRICLPPTIPRLVNSSSSSVIESRSRSSSPGSRQRRGGSLASQLESRQDSQARLTFPTVPLSPVRNSYTGISPSKVSPIRLPAALNKPFVSSGKSEDNVIEAVEVHSQGDNVFDSAMVSSSHSQYGDDLFNTDVRESKPRSRRR